jgi:hypothetical protein
VVKKKEGQSETSGQKRERGQRDKETSLLSTEKEGKRERKDWGT